MSQYSDGKKTDIPMGPAGGYGSNRQVNNKAEDILTNKKDWQEKQKTAENVNKNTTDMFPIDELENEA